MKNGFKVLWTDHALSELQSTFEYLENNWTEKEIVKLVLKLEHTVELISKNPAMFQVSLEKNGIRQAVVMKHNTLYYRIIGETIEILSFFSNRQNPSRRRF
ncbi:type II toxin-antitoxin system RelE/ParE family toxin [Algoriphagus chordae]|uniref:Plasmid stabilization system protein ParE n=1 Tax=Algoriphagus chordae TaxID=237019 RepID=A0A2W7SXP5_9BACT|nr:type II toxin-antitoxin system RelE/ParE family toxin [Algoriphagus chordae]PZX55572.1 plasmid stabilization system protein ParE [Algoriphagus chordae]